MKIYAVWDNREQKFLEGESMISVSQRTLKQRLSYSYRWGVVSIEYLMKEDILRIDEFKFDVKALTPHEFKTKRLSCNDQTRFEVVEIELKRKGEYQ